MDSGRTIKMSVLALISLCAVGCSCAKKDDLALLRREVEEVRVTADQSMAMAKEAQTTANDARGVAELTSTRTTTTEEQLNRVFKKSMQK